MSAGGYVGAPLVPKTHDENATTKSNSNDQQGVAIPKTPPDAWQSLGTMWNLAIELTQKT